jgi:hypothetical protein
MANVSTIPSALKCYYVRAHTKSPLGEMNVINYNTRAGAVSIGYGAKRVYYFAGASTMFSNLGRSRAGHSLGKGRRAG